MANISLLAAGPGDILPVIFVLIAIASGIVNFVKERRAAEQVRPRREGGDDGDDPELRSEIDAFLKEVSGGGGSSQPDTTAAQQQRAQERRRRSREEEERRKRIRARRERERRAREEAVAAATERESVADRHLDTSDIGGVSQRHVESLVENRHLDSHIDDEVLGNERESMTDHIGDTTDAFATGSPSRGEQTATQAALVDMLRRPEGMQTAILLNEILSPPISRRPRS